MFDREKIIVLKMATPFAPESRLPFVQISSILIQENDREGLKLFGIFHPEKQDYLFRCSVARGNFPFPKSRVPFTFRQVNNHDHEHWHPRVRLKI